MSKTKPAKVAIPTIPTDIIEPVRWGRDHLSTLLYVETRVVDHRGLIKIENMRCDAKRHPAFRHLGSDDRIMGPVPPTQLANGKVRANHDDWDCLWDLEAAGIVKNIGTGINPVIRLTEPGWRVVWALRYARGEYFTREVQLDVLRAAPMCDPEFDVFAFTKDRERQP